MGSPVSQAPTSFNLENVRTGQSVVSGGLARLADEISFLNGHNLHHVCDVQINARGSGRTSLQGLSHTIRVPYARSAGAQLARVVIELRASNEVADSQTITTTLPTGASWLDAGGLDGSRTLYNPPGGRTVPREVVGFVDVSGVTVGSLGSSDAFAFACSPSTKGEGIRRVSITEVPLASLAIASGEPGWDAAATRPARPVVDGGSSSPRGMQRLFYCLDQARANWRKHFCLADIETSNTAAYGTTPHWSRETNSTGAIDWGLGGGAPDPHWFLPVRRLYGAAGSATVTSWKWRVRYRTSNAVDCNIDLIARGGSIASSAFTGAAAAATTSMSLPATSGSWAWASSDVTLPGDGTNGLVRVYFEAAGPGVGQLLSIAGIYLTENET